MASSLVVIGNHTPINPAERICLWPRSRRLQIRHQVDVHNYESPFGPSSKCRRQPRRFDSSWLG